MTNNDNVYQTRTMKEVHKLEKRADKFFRIGRAVTTAIIVPAPFTAFFWPREGTFSLMFGAFAYFAFMQYKSAKLLSQAGQMKRTLEEGKIK